MAIYNVVVSNVGNVYSGKRSADAMREYKELVKLSKDNYGRFAGEDVTVFRDGVIFAEYSAPDFIFSIYRILEENESLTLSEIKDRIVLPVGFRFYDQMIDLIQSNKIIVDKNFPEFKYSLNSEEA